MHENDSNQVRPISFSEPMRSSRILSSSLVSDSSSSMNSTGSESNRGSCLKNIPHPNPLLKERESKYSPSLKERGLRGEVAGFFATFFADFFTAFFTGFFFDFFAMMLFFINGLLR